VPGIRRSHLQFPAVDAATHGSNFNRTSCCSASTTTKRLRLIVNRPLVTTGRIVVNLEPPVETERELEVWVGGPVEPKAAGCWGRRCQEPQGGSGMQSWKA